ncbi:MAG: hypothetical protein VB875_16455 [Pirellulales bacterium]
MPNDTAVKKTKEYVRSIPTDWWLKKKSYFWFMVRELTCVFVGGYAFYLLVLVASADDENAFAALVRHPLSVALHIAAVPMVLYHTITWFNLTPKAVVVWRGEDRVSPILIAGSNYVAWLIVSILIAWYALS